MGNNTQHMTDNLTLLSPNAKIKVYWDDQPHNYSREAKNKIKNYFASKYGFNKNNINVIYRPIKKTANGDVIEITGAGIENIMDVNYQRSLMKEFISREGKNIDFNRILALDEKVNGELNIDLNNIQHKSWSIKWIMIDNFLSFGEQNYVPFTKLKGLTIVNSIPANQGGKTTLTIDAIKFLLHGNTTKTDTNEQIFNQFSDKNELVVRGMIEIENEETIIERKMRRTAKKGGGWTVVNKVNYYKILPDGDEEELNEEDAKQTTRKIKDSIGSEKDFEMLVLATEKNLDELIGLTTSESGKILTRLIGLEVLEMKEAIVRTMYNEFSRKKKSNEYDVITLNQEIEEHQDKIQQFQDLEQSLNEELDTAKDKIKKLEEERDELLSNKQTIDVTISELNPDSLEDSIKTITDKGIELGNKVSEIKQELVKIGDVNFDEDIFHELTKKSGSLNTQKALKEAEIKRLKKVVSDLIAGGVCQSCNRKLDDVDNSEHIAKHELDIEKLNNELAEIEKKLKDTDTELETLDVIKKLVDDKNKKELDIDRLEVEMGGLRNKIVEKKNDLRKYNLNLEAINLNRNIEISVTKIKTDLSVENYTKEETIKKIERVQTDLRINAESIVNKNKLISTIKKEEEIDKIFKIYIELVGKKGISKLVLRSVLPIINSELQRLLEDVVDFEVEIFINDKNDVHFTLNKDGIQKLLKSGSGFEKTASSLALRAVLGKLSTLPMPNFITFDEVLGKVAPENLEKLKTLFDKIKDMYEIVFFITHNDLVKDWSDNVITVVKNDNLSKITMK
jgi:DNA repair exonuclease SbcCD ATPase subunit